MFERIKNISLAALWATVVGIAQRQPPAPPVIAQAPDRETAARMADFGEFPAKPSRRLPDVPVERSELS